MNPTAYDQFLRAFEAGNKKAAAAAVKMFVASFSSFGEKEAWVGEFLACHERGSRVRHELYEELVFPVLLRGYRESTVWSIRWLADTVHNLYRAKHLWAQVDFATEQEFLELWRSLEPNSEEAKSALLRRMVETFLYSEHEWPAGILYGSNGANIEECKKIEDELMEARMLDTNGAYASYLDQFHDKLTVYVKRLSGQEVD
jgi:hypothetical protein